MKQHACCMMHVGVDSLVTVTWHKITFRYINRSTLSKVVLTQHAETNVPIITNDFTKA